MSEQEPISFEEALKLGADQLAQMFDEAPGITLNIMLWWMAQIAEDPDLYTDYQSARSAKYALDREASQEDKHWPNY